MCEFPPLLALMYNMLTHILKTHLKHCQIIYSAVVVDTHLFCFLCQCVKTCMKINREQEPSVILFAEKGVQSYPWAEKQEQLLYNCSSLCTFVTIS